MKLDEFKGDIALLSNDVVLEIINHLKDTDINISELIVKINKIHINFGEKITSEIISDFEPLKNIVEKECVKYSIIPPRDDVSSQKQIDVNEAMSRVHKYYYTDDIV